jgi:hypothetical protein
MIGIDSFVCTCQIKHEGQSAQAGISVAILQTKWLNGRMVDLLNGFVVLQSG